MKYPKIFILIGCMLPGVVYLHGAEASQTGKPGKPSQTTPIDLTIEKIACPVNTKYEYKYFKDAETGSYYTEGCKGKDNTYKGEIIKMYREDGSLQSVIKVRRGVFEGKPYRLYSLVYDKHENLEYVSFHDAQARIIGKKVFPKFWHNLARKLDHGIDTGIVKPRVIYTDGKLIFSFEKLPLVNSAEIKDNLEEKRNSILRTNCIDDYQEQERDYFKHGIALVYRYTDNEDQVILSVEFSEDICRKYREERKHD